MDGKEAQKDIAECAVLVAMMSNSAAATAGLEKLVEEDFGSHDRAKIFDTISKLSSAGEEIDPLIVCHKEPDLETQVLALMERHDNVRIEPYAETLVKAREGRMYKRAGRAFLDAIDRGDDPAEAMEAFSSAIALNTDSRSGAVIFQDAVRTAHAEYLATDEGGSDALSTSFSKLDQLLGGGLRRGALYVLAARPGVGKSALALHFTRKLAVQDHAIAYVSLEMSAAECAGRLLTAASGVQKAYKQNFYKEDDKGRLLATCEKIEAMPITFDCPGTIDGIAAFLARENLRAAPRLLAVDYLQLVYAPGHDNQVQEISEISRRLKQLALKHSIPILALSQLNRQLETQKREPALSDLKGSGSIEQDADAVLLMNCIGGDGMEEDKLQLRVAKNRSGPLGELELTFQKPFGRFSIQPTPRLS